jgi:hypothetical protein
LGLSGRLPYHELLMSFLVNTRHYSDLGIVEK